MRGGNQRVVDELAKRVQPQIQMLHRLEAIRSKGSGYTLTFQTDGRRRRRGRRHRHPDDPVLDAARGEDRRRRCRRSRRRRSRELGYGANAKVLVGFNSRPWEKRGYAGNIYSRRDVPAGLGQQLPAGRARAGGLTLYSGGKLAHEAGQGTGRGGGARGCCAASSARIRARSRERNGKVSRFHWPTYPWTKGATPATSPGQWTTIAGAEGLPVGNLFFAGEHCSYDFQGYMNGGAQTGRRRRQGRDGGGERLPQGGAAVLAPRAGAARRDGADRDRSARTSRYSEDVCV